MSGPGFVEKHLADSGARYHRFDNGNTPSILVLPDGNSVPVLLMSHIDVVAAPPEQFEPFEEDGRLYGRGSLDDKYAVALSLVLLKEQLARLRRADRGQGDLPFGLLVTSDEEMGGFDGAGELLRSLRPDFAIVLDGGSPQEMVIKQKGFVKLRGQNCLVDRFRSSWYIGRVWFFNGIPCEKGMLWPLIALTWRYKASR